MRCRRTEISTFFAAGFALLALVIGPPTGAQALPAGVNSPVRWLIDFETGSDEGLGYKLPHLKFGISFERPVGRIELQGGVAYSPDRKYVTNDGNSLRLESRALGWITGRFAITSSLRHSSLWTSQFNKSALYPAIGFAFRENWGDSPGRFYVDYVLPTGCQWGTSCPIQSNRVQGPEFYWETLMYSHFRLGLETGIYHILDQSNNLRPDIPRIGSWTGDTHLVMRFEFPSQRMDKPY
jgi:hypothetical protein